MLVKLSVFVIKNRLNCLFKGKLTILCKVCVPQLFSRTYFYVQNYLIYQFDDIHLQLTHTLVARDNYRPSVIYRDPRQCDCCFTCHSCLMKKRRRKNKLLFIVQLRFVDRQKKCLL